MLIISFVDGTYEKNTNNEVTTIGCEPKAVEYYDRLGTICGLFFVIVIGLIGALLSLF